MQNLRPLNTKYTDLTTNTSGKATTNTACLTSESGCEWRKCGKICQVNGLIVAAKNIQNGEIYFTGLPSAVNGQQFGIPGGANGSGNVIVLSDGSIREWYSWLLNKGERSKFGFTYICE